MNDIDLLVDKKELLKMYPAFSKWSLEWLIRTRRIPIVKIGKRIYFDPEDIRSWIDTKKIKPFKEANNEIQFNKN